MPAVTVTSFTSFIQLFGRNNEELEVQSVEIPLIQRDYAQGRKGENIRRIRIAFVETLCGALVPGAKPVGLDFVYGDVKDKKLYPLDGQQRLTTLFLLHWYLACRADIATAGQSWAHFSYATRPGARLFCRVLTEHQPEQDAFSSNKTVSAWLTDQAWYLYTWRHDPTIQSMLVMLDELHGWFSRKPDFDFRAAWQRLTDSEHPAISFHILPLPSSDLTDDLYIKMNSRGKPLTPFENFKARFEEMLAKIHSAEAESFAQKVDTVWSDILWNYRGDDNLIDDEFMRYFRFATEVCAWQDSIAFSSYTRIDELTRKVYGPGVENAPQNLRFLFGTFDTWVPQVEQDRFIREKFEEMFTAVPTRVPEQLLLFATYGQKSPVDLFAACCRHYGESGQGWTLADTLLLYGVMLHRVEGHEQKPDFPRQLRILRNLIEASKDNEIRSEKMSDLIADVRRIIEGDLAGVVAFNKAQLLNEQDKAALLTAQPEIRDAVFLLEDHRVLSGCLAAFDLDDSISPEIFSGRMKAFYEVFDSSELWTKLTGALLAIGDYSRSEPPRWTGYRVADFGAPYAQKWWRGLLKARLGENPHPSRRVLMELLDRIAAASSATTCLAEVRGEFLADCEAKGRFDWRYYFVKYDIMRTGASGRYMINRSGYQACMLEKTVMRSYYRDPYLYAVALESRLKNEIENYFWFIGYEDEPRRLRFVKSGLQVECVDEGFKITAPTNPDFDGFFEEYRTKSGLTDDLVCHVPQQDGIDSSNRVHLGAKLLNELVESGL